MSLIALQLTADDIRWESKLWQDRGLEKSVTKFLILSRVTFRCLSCTTQAGQLKGADWRLFNGLVRWRCATALTLIDVRNDADVRLPGVSDSSVIRHRVLILLFSSDGPSLLGSDRWR
jgi:hypothetical protein